jgi:hypothetical protein
MYPHRALRGTRRARRHSSLGIALLFLLAGLPLAAWGGEGGASRLQAQYQELRDLAQRGPFGVPLRVRSEVRSDQVIAEVHGIIEHPFEAVRTALSTPASWCEFAPLHLNVKACTYQIQSQETLLTLYVGRRRYKNPETASSQSYQFAVDTKEAGFLSVDLSAPEGLFGTSAHRILVEAAGAEDRTVIALSLSYVPSALTRLMTTIYLETAARNRVGFTREDTDPTGSPRYVKGFTGLVERSAMRYYLAFKAYLDVQSVPATHRFESCINAAYDLFERYPTQLRDLGKAEYLDVKRREREDQLRLQQKLDAAGSRPNDR